MPRGSHDCIVPSWSYLLDSASRKSRHLIAQFAICRSPGARLVRSRLAKPPSLSSGLCPVPNSRLVLAMPSESHLMTHRARDTRLLRSTTRRRTNAPPVATGAQRACRPKNKTWTRHNHLAGFNSISFAPHIRRPLARRRSFFTTPPPRNRPASRLRPQRPRKSPGWLATRAARRPPR